MAGKTPPGKGKKGKNDALKNWLNTDDWLGVGNDSVPVPGTPASPVQTPMPDAIGGDMPATSGPGSVLPLGAEKSPDSQMKKSESPSSARIAGADLAELTAQMSVPDPDSDDAIDLATPPDGAMIGPPSISKIMKATGAKSDIIRGAALPKSSDNSDIHTGHFNPTGPGSGWLGGSAARMAAPPKSSGSQADIGRSPARGSEDVSDIFSGARHSDAGKDGTGSNLLPGMSGIGRSSVFSDASRSGINPGAESDLFAGLTGGTGDRGSSMYDDSANKTQKVKPIKDLSPPRNVPKPDEDDDDGDPSGNVPLIDDDYFAEATKFDERPLQSGPRSSGRLADQILAELNTDSSSPDYDRTDKSGAGSNLFEDVTALDIDITSEPGASGVNWMDPNRTGAQDSGPGSSIFIKPPTSGEDSGHGNVDLSQIPLLGSTDDPADMIQNSDLAGPASSVMRRDIEKTMRELASEHGDASKTGAISFDMPDDRIPWGPPQSNLAEQASMRMPVTDDELDLLASPESGSVVGFGKKPKADSDSVFDDAPDFRDGSAIGLGAAENSGIMTGPTSFMTQATSDSLRAAAAEAAAKAATKAKKPQPRLSTPTPSSRDFELIDEPKTKSKKSGLLITAASLLVGVGAGAAGMYFAKPDKSDGSKNPIAQMKAAKSDPTLAPKLLAAGDPATALAAFTENGDESSEARAGRGQARWMAKVRKLNEIGEKVDSTDMDISAARADLKSVVDSADRLQTPEEQAALLKAALNLGLILEATKKPDEAIKHYKAMAKQFAAKPQFKKVFESAEKRVFRMQRPDNVKMTDDKYSFSPEALHDLGIANVILAEFAAVQPDLDEAGFHFWEAMDYASANKYKEAIDSITAARKAHEKQRMTKLGMGLNPLSDPTEQMFSRACHELNNYYVFKRQMYDDPLVGPYARANFTRATMDKMIADFKSVNKLTSDLAKAKQDATKAVKDATAALAAKTKAEQLAATLQVSDTKAKEAVTMLTSEVAEYKKAQEALVKASSEAGDKLKKAEAALDPVIEKLKAAKLIEDKATREQALALLPELAKKPNFLTTGTGTNAEMAKELVALRETAKKEKDDAEKKIADLTALTKDATARMETAVKNAQRETTQQYADKLADAELKAKRAAEEVAIAKKAQEDKLAAQAEEHRVQLALTRAGVNLALTDAERNARDQAAKAYGQGLEAFRGNRFADANSFFTSATSKNPNDARYWYYLGLAKTLQGAAATDDYKKGAQLEARGLPAQSVINNDLLYVQGGLRQTLDRVRP
ncbi:hypothetical protein BH11PLA2_BH11PLA2_12640 [soil metagenome]